MVVTLVGYRGSGKTSVASRLAARLACDFVDADAEVERRAGRSIRAIFEAEGEDRFRQLERDLLEELLQRDRMIVSAGGGAVLDPRTRRRMQAAGPVVWLRATAEVLAARIGGDPSTRESRPSLTGDDVQQEVARVLAEREPLYREVATIVVDTASLDVEGVVDRIVAELARRGATP